MDSPKFHPLSHSHSVGETPPRARAPATHPSDKGAAPEGPFIPSSADSGISKAESGGRSGGARLPPNTWGRGLPCSSRRARVYAQFHRPPHARSPPPHVPAATPQVVRKEVQAEKGKLGKVEKHLKARRSESPAALEGVSGRRPQIEPSPAYPGRCAHRDPLGLGLLAGRGDERTPPWSPRTPCDRGRGNRGGRDRIALRTGYRVPLAPAPAWNRGFLGPHLDSVSLCPC